MIGTFDINENPSRSGVGGAVGLASRAADIDATLLPLLVPVVEEYAGVVIIMECCLYPTVIGNATRRVKVDVFVEVVLVFRAVCPATKINMTDD